MKTRKKLIALFGGMAILALLCAAVPEAISASKVIKWNLSLWGGPREWTYPAERWAKDMETLTNGGWQIKLHYAEALAPAKENIDGIKAGLFEGCHICCVYTPAKLPLHTVMDLPFLAPEKSLEISLMIVALWEHPAIKKELLKWNAVPLLPGNVLNYNVMGNKPIYKVDDLKGIRIRISGEPARVMKMFGAVPTMVTAPELYETLERGTIDLAAFPWPDAFGNFKIHEVSKYAIVNLNLGAASCAYVANKNSWDALPKEYQKIHMEWYHKKAPYEWAKDAEECEKKWIPVFKKKLQVIEFPPEERSKWLQKAEIIYEEWVKKWEGAGLPAREILNYALAKRKEIAGY